MRSMACGFSPIFHKISASMPWLVQSSGARTTACSNVARACSKSPEFSYALDNLRLEWLQSGLISSACLSDEICSGLSQVRGRRQDPPTAGQQWKPHGRLKGKGERLIRAPHVTQLHDGRRPRMPEIGTRCQGLIQRGEQFLLRRAPGRPPREMQAMRPRK